MNQQFLMTNEQVIQWLDRLGRTNQDRIAALTRIIQRAEANNQRDPYYRVCLALLNLLTRGHIPNNYFKAQGN